MPLNGPYPNALLDADESLLGYVLSLLRGAPIPPPRRGEDEWRRLLELLQSQGVAPLLYWRVKRSDPRFHPPSPVLANMRWTFLAAAARSLRVLKQIRELSDAFRGAGIPFLFMKGPAMAWGVYPDPGTRPFGDLDILIAPAGYRRARRRISALGYRCVADRFETRQAFACEERFVRPGQGGKDLPVELHWDLVYFFGAHRPYDPADLFRGARTLPLPDGTIETLGPDDALIQSALHMTLMHRHEMRLMWVCDVGQMARAYREDHSWRRLLESARQMNALAALGLSLKAASLWTGLDPPAFVKARLEGHRPTTGEERAWRGAGRDWRETQLILLARGRAPVFRKAWMLFRYAAPPVENIRAACPDSKRWRLPLGYLRRWKKLLTGLLRIRAGKKDRNAPIPPLAF
jgi:hypothetical protein